jgi:hypothetical protein
VTLADRAAGEAAAMKACCAEFYGGDAVARLLGQAFHPGGRDLTRRLARMACLRPGERVLDVASGPGDSAALLAREFGVRVHGVDLSRDLVTRASTDITGRRIDELVTFSVGDAERLPVGTAAFDGVLCECALCTFPRKRRAVGELARAIAPGGRLMLSDVVVDRDRLPPELQTPLTRVACIADALPLDGYLRLLEGSGLRVCGLEQHDEAVVRMGQRIDAQLELAASLRLGAGLDIAGIRRLVGLATRAAEDGIIGYAILTAEPDRETAAA